MAKSHQRVPIGIYAQDFAACSPCTKPVNAKPPTGWNSFLASVVPQHRDQLLRDHSLCHADHCSSSARCLHSSTGSVLPLGFFLPLLSAKQQGRWFHCPYGMGCDGKPICREAEIRKAVLDLPTVCVDSPSLALTLLSIHLSKAALAHMSFTDAQGWGLARGSRCRQEHAHQRAHHSQVNQPRSAGAHQAAWSPTTQASPFRISVP